MGSVYVLSHGKRDGIGDMMTIFVDETSANGRLVWGRVERVKPMNFKIERKKKVFCDLGGN